MRDADSTGRELRAEEGRGAGRKALAALLMLLIGVGIVVNGPTADAGGLHAAGRSPDPLSASAGVTGTGSSGASLSGTIIDGLFTGGYAVGCTGVHREPLKLSNYTRLWMADCAAWLAAGCPADLAGVEPAWHTSIVSVASRAGTSRVFEVRRGTGESILLGGVRVQFWTKGCTELQSSSHSASSKARYVNGIRLGRHWDRATLVIPDRATWMTVSANDNLNIRWTLQ